MGDRDRHWDKLREAYKPCSRPCGWDEELGVMVHRFGPGRVVCRCGQRVVRRPVKAQRAGWYGKGHTWPDLKPDSDPDKKT